MCSCLFVETSAKANVAVGQAFEELLMKVGRKGWCQEEVGRRKGKGVGGRGFREWSFRQWVPFQELREQAGGLRAFLVLV